MAWVRSSVAGYKERIEQLVGSGHGPRTAEEREHTATEVIHVCSVGAAAVVVQPLPMLDIALLTPIHVAMVKAIGGIYGYTLDRKTALAIIGAFGASIAAQNLVLGSAKLVPVAGLPVAISVAYAVTHAVGEASRAYFQSGWRLSRARMKQVFHHDYSETKRAKLHAAKQDRALGDQLARINDAHRAGVLTEEEYERQKHDVLARL